MVRPPSTAIRRPGARDGQASAARPMTPSTVSSGQDESVRRWERQVEVAAHRHSEELKESAVTNCTLSQPQSHLAEEERRSAYARNGRVLSGAQIRSTPANAIPIADRAGCGDTLNDLASRFGATRMQVFNVLREYGMAPRRTSGDCDASSTSAYQADNANVETKTARMIAFRAATRLAC